MHLERQPAVRVADRPLTSVPTVPSLPFAVRNDEDEESERAAPPKAEFIDTY